MINPFDLRGPEFLVFYAFLGGILLAALELWRRYTENAVVPKVNLNDPYEIAFLRGGQNEALRVATIALVDRSLIKASGTMLQSEKGASDLVRRPIEKAVLSKFQSPRESTSIFTDAGLTLGWKPYEEELERLGLIPNQNQKNVKLLLRMAAAAILVLVAVCKIDIAIQRGRHNIEFLILSAGFFSIAVFWRNPSRTPAGDVVLQDLQELFASLKGRISAIKPGGSTNELAMVVAVFGMNVLALTAAYAHLKTLYPKASAQAAYGFTCGTSCGTSCGSSCGGGGCGGGCGGCGS